MTAEAKTDTAPNRVWARFKRMQLGLPLVIISMGVVTGLIEPRFWSFDNLFNLSRQLAPLMILVSGQVFAVISGGLDLSVASVLAFAGVVGVLVIPDVGIGGGLALMVVTGAFVGLINGLIITRFRVSPLIVTLGMLSVAKGLALILTGGIPNYDVPEVLVDTLGYGGVFGVPVPAIFAVATLLFGAFLLKYTVFGRYVYAIGSNSTAAFNSGINVKLHTTLVYVMYGGMAGVADLLGKRGAAAGGGWAGITIACRGGGWRRGVDRRRRDHAASLLRGPDSGHAVECSQHGRRLVVYADPDDRTRHCNRGDPRSGAARSEHRHLVLSTDREGEGRQFA